MAEASNVGSASHLGGGQTVRDSHFVYDYSYRRVPMPVVSYMAVADNGLDLPTGENLAKQALDVLKDHLEPAVIAEEELDRSHMETLIRESFAEVDKKLFEHAAGKNLSGKTSVSLTVAVSDRRRAYIGHIGTNRVYLLHSERLYDLTPTGNFASPLSESPAGREVVEPPVGTPSLFDVPTGGPPAEPPHSPSGDPDAAATVLPEGGAGPSPVAGVQPPAQDEQASPAGGSAALLGQGGAPEPVYNEVQIEPGDTLILCTDGLWKTVTEEEMVENLLGSPGAQRSASQLVRLAFNRDHSDNATMVAWQYPVPGVTAPGRERETRSRQRKTKALDVVLLALLAIILAGIFAVGCAFGWRVTDAFRKPQKEAAQQHREAAALKAEEERKQEAEEARKQQEAEEEAAVVAAEKTAKTNADGVRMREAADTQSKIVGLLRDGQQVTILGESAGTDGKTWYRIRATVRSQGQDTVMEGFARSEFLTLDAAPSPGSATQP